MEQAPNGNVFGMILAGEIPSYQVYSDDACYAFLDIYPQAPGHTLVIPRRYSPNLLAAGTADVLACLSAVQRLAPVIMAATNTRGVTVISNQGKEAGQTVEYLHFHIIPRFSGDEVSLHRPGKLMPPEELLRIQAQITFNLG